MINFTIAGSVSGKERRRDKLKRSVSKLFDRRASAAGDVVTPGTTEATTSPPNLVVSSPGVVAGIQVPVSLVPEQIAVPATGTQADDTAIPGNETPGVPSIHITIAAQEATIQRQAGTKAEGTPTPGNQTPRVPSIATTTTAQQATIQGPAGTQVPGLPTHPGASSNSPRYNRLDSSGVPHVLILF